LAVKLRGGLLGAGNIALRGHAPQWQSDSLAQDVEIVAVADLSPENLAKARAVFPAARLYDKAEHLIEREALDFCDVCTPPFTHRALVEALAARKLHVICEKPIASTLADAEAMADTVRRAKIAFVPCHQYHYSPQWVTVKRLLARIGRIYLVDYEVLRTEANPGNANWAPTWRTDRNLAGGGILFDHGAHIFYQLRSVLGDPASVLATVRTLLHTHYDVEDSAFVVLDYGDRLAHVRLTWAAHRREIRFRFVGEQGELVGDDRRVTVAADTTEDVSFDDGMSKDSSHSDWFAPLFRDFIERVRRSDTSCEPLDEAVAVTRLVTRAYESSDDGRALLLAARTPAVVGRALSAVEAAVSKVAEVEESEAPVEPAAAAPRRQPWTVRLAAAGLLIFAGAWAMHGVDWRALGHAFHGANLLWILAAALVNGAAIYAMSGRWLALVRPLSRKVSWLEAFKAMMVGFAVSTVVPARAGELARAEWLSRRSGLPRVSLLGTIVLDHLVNGIGMFAGIAAMPLLFEIPSWLRPGIILAAVVFGAATLAVLFLRPQSAAVSDTPGAEGPVKVRSLVGRFVAHARTGLSAVRDRRALGLSLLASFAAWALEIYVILFAMRAFDLHLPLAASFLMLMAVNLALVVPFAPPANLGTLEVGAMFALMEFGVPKEQALALALTYHALQIVPIAIASTLFGGLAVLSPLPARESGRT
jgi:glycosyltransferase AglD